MNDLLEGFSNNYISFHALSGWFSSRLTTLNLVIVLIPVYLYVFLSLNFREDINTINIVLFLLKTNALVNDFNRLMYEICSSESEFVSYERCLEFENWEIEEGYNFNDKNEIQNLKRPYNFDIMERMKEPLAIPSIKFDGVSTKYPSSNTMVLNKVDLILKKGEKVGIVGRTGSGKSSLIKLLWLDL